MSEHHCPKCEGSRLNKESLHFKVGDKQIHQLTAMDISEFDKWLQTIEKQLNKNQLLIAKHIIKELKKEFSLF